jgi:sporulation protein YlmC with PRC-barrel domain
MRIHLGADVVNFEGQVIGTVKQVVIDPVTRDIKDLIVEQGFLFTEDKVLPISLVMQADEQEVKLYQTDQDLDDLRTYREESYFPISIPPETKSPTALIPGNYLAMRPRFVYKLPQKELAAHKKNIARNKLPDHLRSLKIGANVVTLDEEKVGEVEEIMAVPETTKATHLVVSRGLVDQESILIPIDWLDKIDDEKITLLVDSTVIENLPSHLEREESIL